MKGLVRAFALVGLLVAGQGRAAVTVDDLFTAVSIDNLRDVRRIVQAHLADAKATDSRGDTLLIAAIRSDATEVTDWLIAEPSTDLEATDTAHETALMIAAYRNKKDIVEKLLARKAEVNRTGWTALHYAASVDAHTIVAVLLDHAAYVDAESPNKTTPLMMAARGGFDEMARQLVEAGADPTLVNDRDLTAADFARRANSMDLAQWLDARAVAWREKYRIPPRRENARQ